jgi:superfamily II DNA or RNA helicase
MVSLLRHIRQEFNHLTRQRGDEIWRDGGVRNLSGDEREASALVTGNQTYQVNAERDEEDLLTSCQCPYFADHLSCKHVWAFLHAAEAKGLLDGPDGSSPRFMLPLDKGSPEKLLQVNQNWRNQAQPVGLKKRDWRSLLERVQGGTARSAIAPESWPEQREIFFVISGRPVLDQGVSVDLLHRDPLKKGGWGKLKSARIAREAFESIPDPALKELLLSLAGVPDPYDYSGNSLQTVYKLRGKSAAFYLRRMCATGLCYFRHSSETPQDQWSRLEWDDGPPWLLQLHMEHLTEEKVWRLAAALRRGDQEMDLSKPWLLIEEGLLIASQAGQPGTGQPGTGTIAALDHQGAFAWATALRKDGAVIIPDKHASEFAFEVIKKGSPEALQWPAELAYDSVPSAPVPWFSIETANGYRRPATMGHLRFRYGDHVVESGQEDAAFADFEARRIVPRDLNAEGQAEGVLRSLGLRPTQWYSARSGHWEVPANGVQRVIPELVKRGWRVEAEGIRYRTSSGFEASLRSGIDWFELDAEVDYDGTRVELPQLLKAISKGAKMVELGAGEYGLIPEDLLERYRLLAGLGHAENGSIRFGKNQAGLLDVLLSERPEVSVDQVFAEARTKLRGFSGVHAPEQPAGFQGTLRDYQREGLGWMKFLDEFGLGGCLADDMGVGKTPQVLALLELRREARAKPSLIVVPRSLVYNWKQEASRFTPQLRILDHTVADRNKQSTDFSSYNAVLATYGTIRRDAADFRAVEFDYVILDEAQAIKNASSESAKAARLLNGRRRLALSGTPVENHLGELWSLFEFLNPGMLGTGGAFKNVGSLRNPDEETRQTLARSVRPFILRRTKEQVARELPPKQEQTIYCDLDPKQRELYNELRDFYRKRLLDRVSRDGIGKSKIQVLEALLRLRQAACHPALLGAKHQDAPSAKLDLLLERLSEVIDEGHKALVFSQFTSMLALVRTELDKQGVTYEYLDGQTRDRQARVERFQTAPDVPLFLISLKAGGVGLNLTAADYVFLLDPWWNPAVEAQAIDRTHRIGQERSVFAYRLIARDTVEEKVLELQSKKRDLAAAIINADNSLIRDLKVEDLEVLLS